jgi:tetratricopeptide (TPR) repeat protein
MKKLVLSATLLLSVATFAQKDELKTLKKLYAKEAISEKDLVSYKTASDALQNLATEEGEKVYAKFYKTMTPTVELTSKGNKVSPQDLMKVFNPEFIKEYGAITDEVIEFEKKSGKKILTDELIADKESFKTEISNMALDLNKASKFKEASALFYSLYIFDPKKEGKSLQNAAILAVQAKDYVLGQKYYEEFYNSDYFATASTYYAINKANGVEEDLGSRENRTKLISLGVYEKPRDEKISKTKPEMLKILSILYSENKEFDKAKVALTEARALLPNDEDLKTTEFNLYFNEGYASLTDEAKLVDQINASTADKKKYDDLMNQRKAMFQKALPAFEKAYSINPADENTKSILKIAYDVTGQKEKANAIK